MVSPSYKILFMPDPVTILKNIEIAGRTCYKSEDRITEESAAGFVDRILKSGHHSVIEHVNLTVRFICDRGVTHELVRHRLASYSQESTRYANYAKEKFGSEITVIKPPFWNEDSAEYQTWLAAMEYAEKAYLNMIEMGARPEQARSVLPNSLKTEIVMTCNVREWRHVFKLRCSKAAHPQIRELLMPLLQELGEKIPVLFRDILEDIESFWLPAKISGTAKCGTNVVPLKGRGSNDSLTPAWASVPFDEIVSLYHEVLPELPKVRILTDKRKSRIAARWNEAPQRQDLHWWRGYFESVREQSYLMGGNDRGWMADLDFLVKAEKMARVIEKSYQRGNKKLNRA